MNRRCVALLSGGLDSKLAIRMMLDQGIEVEAINFRTIFGCCKDDAARTAHELGVRLTVLDVGEDYLDVVKRPIYGYGKGMNPCVDCRIFMFALAKNLMRQIDASFIVSGEVVGQRPMSQKLGDLNVIARDAELDDILLRPLSAKLLPPTLPERTGIVDRERLYAFEGRSRKGLIELARQYGFTEIPTPSTGCVLTEPRFGDKVADLIEFSPDSRQWDFELLRIGRHFRFDAERKVVVGKDAAQNEQLAIMARDARAGDCTLIEPVNFKGPSALVVGSLDDDVAEFVGGLVLRYSKEYDPSDAKLRWAAGGELRTLQARVGEEAGALETV